MGCTGISCTSFLSASLPCSVFGTSGLHCVSLHTHFLVSRGSRVPEASNTAQLALVGDYHMSLFFCSLFSGTISAAGGCILGFASHHGSTVVPLLLGGPFLPLSVCKGCVYASPFSPCCHLFTGWIIWTVLNSLCLSWETEARHLSANQHGSAPSTGLIRSPQAYLKPWFQHRWHKPHAPPLCFDVVLVFQVPPQPPRILAWMSDPLPFRNWPDAVFPYEKLQNFSPTEQAALALAGRDGLGSVFDSTSALTITPMCLLVMIFPSSPSVSAPQQAASPVNLVQPSVLGASQLGRNAAGTLARGGK